MQDFQRAFVDLLVEYEVVRFGEFTLKSGRRSPYFVNAGQLRTGDAIGRLGDAFADRIVSAGVACDLVFGPSYKGVPLAVATASAMARRGRDVGFGFDRKEAKDHGEGGTLVGAPLRGRVLVVDDVMSAGTAVRESIAMIRAAGATPHAVVIALDRQEMATEDGRDVPHSAVQYVRRQLGLQVCAIARLEDLLQYLAHGSQAALAEHHGRVLAYRQRYGVQEGATP